MKQRSDILILFFILVSQFTFGQDSLTFKGQVSAWSLYNGGLELPVYAGARYIPQLNYEVSVRERGKLDFEASANINGSFGTRPFDTINTEGQIKPYRLWARFSTDQLEIRVGLQKINFGSASMLRPLMWFDQVDPRDPLRLTDGVWAILGRYYFLNNVNVWAWVLYGNEDPKGWEFAGSDKTYPEFGGRFQTPVPAGELGLSYHHRTLNSDDLGNLAANIYDVRENRFGLDLRLDLVVGAWLEGAWINNSENMGMYSNQEIFNAGLDYTFGIGNGLLLTYEQLFVSYDQTAFAFDNAFTFSLLSMSYPIGLFDNISAIVYYDWENNKLYNFINWQKTFNHISMYLMAFWNPEDYKIPTQEIGQNLFAGKGFQLMFVYNH